MTLDLIEEVMDFRKLLIFRYDINLWYLLYNIYSLLSGQDINLFFVQKMIKPQISYSTAIGFINWANWNLEPLHLYHLSQYRKHISLTIENWDIPFSSSCYEPSFACKAFVCNNIDSFLFLLSELTHGNCLYGRKNNGSILLSIII